MYKPLKEITIKEAITILHNGQKWRRGCTNIEPPSPYNFGLAIDYAIKHLRRELKQQKEKENAKL